MPRAAQSPHSQQPRPISILVPAQSSARPGTASQRQRGASVTNKEPSVGHAGHCGEGWDEEHNPLLDTSALEGTREPGPEKRLTEQRLGGSKQLTGTALQQTCIPTDWHSFAEDLHPACLLCFVCCLCGASLPWNSPISLEMFVPSAVFQYFTLIHIAVFHFDSY